MRAAFLNYIHSSKSNFLLKLIRSFLYILSLFFKLGVTLKNYCFDHFNCSSQPEDSFIVSIGNIVAGGTGKTPFTIKVAKKLVSQGKKVAILSRGYKAKMEHHKTPWQINHGYGTEVSSLECGDEPYLICKHVPETLFFVGKNRLESAKLATAQKADIILLDDGMQHRKLSRNYEIVILDLKDPFGKNYYLPRGFLRDSPSSLKRANLIVVNHVDCEIELKKLINQIRLYSLAPVVGMQVEYLRAVDQNGIEVDLRNQKIAAFCGIAKPKYFFDLLGKLQAQLILKKELDDHQSVNQEWLNSFSHQAMQFGAQFVVCTEKDAVKLPLDLKMPIPLVYAQMNLKVVYGKENFEKAMHEIAISRRI